MDCQHISVISILHSFYLGSWFISIISQSSIHFILDHGLYPLYLNPPFTLSWIMVYIHYIAIPHSLYLGSWFISIISQSPIHFILDHGLYPLYRNPPFILSWIMVYIHYISILHSLYLGSWFISIISQSSIHFILDHGISILHSLYLGSWFISIISQYFFVVSWPLLLLAITRPFSINGDLTTEFSRPIELIELSPFYHNHITKHNFQVIKKKKKPAICWAHCVILACHYIWSSITKIFQLFIPCLLSCTVETGTHFAGTTLKLTAMQ